MLSEETREIILCTLHERGALTKDDIITTWNLNDEDYKELRKQLSKKKKISPGSRKNGGFLVKRSREREPDESISEFILLRPGWEQQTIIRLDEILQRPQVEGFLGALFSALRQTRHHQTGVDRKSTKKELLAALVIRYGKDLLRESLIRRAIAKACDIRDYVERWHPGKTAAYNFVNKAGLPLDLAGESEADSLPDHEYIEGRFQLKPLRDFQQEVKHCLLETLNEWVDKRAIVTLPTGAGKTRVAVETIRDWLTVRYASRPNENADTRPCVLWLAHTEELCEQAYTCFKQVWEASESVCPIRIFRFWGSYTQDFTKHNAELSQIRSTPSVLVSTPQRIVNLLDTKIIGAEPVLIDLRNSLAMVAVDEAHRGAAPSYRRIFSELGSNASNHIAVVGLTATPFRREYFGQDADAGTKELQAIFVNLIEPSNTLGTNPREKLEELRILATPKFEIIKTPTRIRFPDEAIESLSSGSEPTEDQVEKIDQALKIQADNSPRRLAVLKEIVPLAQHTNNSILYFGPSVNDAEIMAFLLRRENIPAAVISGTTRDTTRRQVISDFKAGNIRVLCNCEVLTTGFDAPRVTHIVVARPTVSRVLYEQIVGRGLRGPEFGGTEVCVILNCEDNFQGERPKLGYEQVRHIWS